MNNFGLIIEKKPKQFQRFNWDGLFIFLSKDIRKSFLLSCLSFYFLLKFFKHRYLLTSQATNLSIYALYIYISFYKYNIDKFYNSFIKLGLKIRRSNLLVRLHKKYFKKIESYLINKHWSYFFTNFLF